MNALIVARFAEMGIASGRGDLYIHGAANVTFFNSSNKTPPAGRYFFSVHRQGSGTLRESLGVSHAVGLLEKKYAELFPTLTTLVEYTCADNNGKRDLFVAVMMRAEEFDNFQKFVELHFYADGETTITVPFYGFGQTEHQNGTTEKEFYEGKPQVIFDQDIAYSFRRPGQK